MDQKTRFAIQSALRQARQVVAKLEALVSLDVAIAPAVQETVAKRLANRICLGCLQPIAPNDREKRGNHLSCYNTMRARIRAGGETEEGLIAQGKLTAESKRPGRPAAIDLAIEQAASDLADDIAAGKPRRKRRST